MKKLTTQLFAFLIAMFASQTMMAQDVIFAETFAESQGDFVVEGNNGEKNNIWEWSKNYKGMCADAYDKIGAKEALENFLVSPVIKMGTECQVTFEQNNVYFTDVSKEAGFCIRKAGTTEWTQLEVNLPVDNAGMIEVGPIVIPVEFENQDVQLAFRYSSPGSKSSGIWVVNNLFVIGTPYAEPEPQPESSIIFSEAFDKSLGDFMFEGNNGKDNNVWYWDADYEAATADAFEKIGDPEEITAYLVSPAMTLGKNNTISFDEKNKFFNYIDKQIGFFVRELGAADWTKIEIVYPQDEKKYVNTGDIALPVELEGKDVQFAFMYSSPGSSGSGIFIVKNFVVKGELGAEPEPEPEPSTVLFEESFLETMGDFVVEGNNGEGNNIWQWDSYYNAVVADAYGKIGAKEYVENYLVSPVITLASKNTVTFDQNNLYFSDPTTEIGLYIRNAGTTDWIQLEATFLDNQGNVLNVGDIAIPSEYDGKAVQFGFRYTTPGSNVSGIWIITNFVVKGSVDDPTSIDGIEEDVNADNNIYDLQGRRVINPTKGLYIINGKKVIIR